MPKCFLDDPFLYRFYTSIFYQSRLIFILTYPRLILLFVGSSIFPGDFGAAKDALLWDCCFLKFILGVRGMEAANCGLGKSKGPVGLFRAPFNVNSPHPLPLVEFITSKK